MKDWTWKRIVVEILKLAIAFLSGAGSQNL